MLVTFFFFLQMVNLNGGTNNRVKFGDMFIIERAFILSCSNFSKWATLWSSTPSTLEFSKSNSQGNHDSKQTHTLKGMMVGNRFQLQLRFSIPNAFT